MGYLKYVKQLFNKPSDEQKALLKQRMIEWRAEPATLRIERPTRIDRARTLGYKPKPGVIIVRQRVLRGGHVRPDIKGGRRPSRFHQTKNLDKNYQWIAEERAARAYVNCAVLGSYQAGQDGQHAWFEVLLVDRVHPSVLADDRLLGVAFQGGRTQRGLTSAGRKARGLRRKGTGAEKVRPSSRMR